MDHLLLRYVMGLLMLQVELDTIKLYIDNVFGTRWYRWLSSFPVQSKSLTFPNSTLSSCALAEGESKRKKLSQYGPENQGYYRRLSLGWIRQCGYAKRSLTNWELRLPEGDSATEIICKFELAGLLSTYQQSRRELEDFYSVIWFDKDKSLALKFWFIRLPQLNHHLHSHMAEVRKLDFSFQTGNQKSFQPAA